MSFELRVKQSVGKNMRRIAGKQLDGVLQELTGKRKGTLDKAVHEARKHFKKVRAILRLVRPEIGAKIYRAQNTLFRDTGRPLTDLRDAKIVIESLDGLAEHFKDDIAARTFAGVRDELKRKRRAARTRILKEQNGFTLLAGTIRQARAHVKEWADVPDRWTAIGRGLEDTCHEAHIAYEKAVVDPNVKKLHEWRKQTKYFRYQLEMLRPLWPERLKELADEADRMCELLGDDHDWAVLRQLLTNEPDRFGDSAEQELLLALIDRRRAGLQQEVFLLGERFFQDRPKEFVRRLTGYWKAWIDQAGEKATKRGI